MSVNNRLLLVPSVIFTISKYQVNLFVILVIFNTSEESIKFSIEEKPCEVTILAGVIPKIRLVSLSLYKMEVLLLVDREGRIELITIKIVVQFWFF